VLHEVNIMVDPCIGLWLRGHIHRVVHPDIPLKETNLICFPVSHVYFFVGGGPKSIAKLGGGWPDFPPGSATGWTYCLQVAQLQGDVPYSSGSQPFDTWGPLKNFYLLVVDQQWKLCHAKLPICVYIHQAEGCRPPVLLGPQVENCCLTG